MRVLILEDLSTDADLAIKEISRVVPHCEFSVVETRREFEEALACFRPDAIISDYKLPSFDGMTALELVQRQDPDLPFIIVTGSINEETAVECMKAGAWDYVIKEHLRRLGPAFLNALNQKQLRKERKAAEQRFLESEELYRKIFEDHAAVKLLIDPQTGSILDANRAAEEFYGWPRATLRQMLIQQINTMPSDQVKAEMEKARSLKRVHFEFQHRKADGSVRDVAVYSSRIELKGREILHSIVHDITDRKLAEASLSSSESRLRRYVENAPIGIFQIDGKGNFLDANPAVLQFTGYTAGEIRAMSVLDLVPEESRGEVARFLGLLKDCGWSSWESPILQKGGTRRWWQVEGMFFEEGRYLGYATDTTEERKALSDLARESVYLEQLFQHSPLTIQLCELDGTILRVNPACEKMFGFSQQELMGHRIDEFIVPEEEREIARRYTESFSSGDALAFEARRMRKDGTLIDVAFTGFSVRLDGNQTGVFAIYRDITKWKQAERDLEEINRQLRQKVSELERAWEQSIHVLAIASEARDPYTAGHQRRVARLSRAIALEMGMGETRSRQVEMAALIHDIGKIEVPSEILVKPGRLNPLEFKLIQVHPATAHRILSSIELPWPLAEIVYQHHEAMDGSGYPRGLAGEQILPEARIISVADTVEAMSSHRPYRPAHGLEAALEELRKCRGGRYDAAVVDACLEVFAKGFSWDG